MTLTEFERFADENNIVPVSTEIYSQMISNSVKYAKMKKVLQEIRQEIESNMESIIGKYDSSTSERNFPSHKIERNNGRKECIAIIDKHIKEIEGSDKE